MHCLCDVRTSFSWILHFFVDKDIYFILLINGFFLEKLKCILHVTKTHCIYWCLANQWQVFSRKISDTWLMNTEINIKLMFSWRFYSLPHFHQELTKSKNIQSMKILLVLCVVFSQLSICIAGTRKYFLKTLYIMISH